MKPSLIFIQSTLVLAFVTLPWRMKAAEILDPEPRPANKTYTTGRLVTIEIRTGEKHRLHRRDVASVLNNDTHKVGLQLDDGSGLLHMELHKGSVWGPESILEATWERHRLRFSTNTTENEGCHLYGHLTSLEGSVSLNICGRMVGLIVVDGQRLEISEIEDSQEVNSGRFKLTHTEVNVTRTTFDSEGNDTLRDGFGVAEELIEKARRTLGQRVGGTRRNKRELPEVTIEVALFADAWYMNHLFDMGYDTTLKAHSWFVQKWNTIQGIFTNIKKIGFRVRIKIVKMELWWYNPQGYVPPFARESVRLDWFCQNTPQGDGADQKVLYTHDTGAKKFKGWTDVGGTCIHNRNCYLVKSPTLDSAIELHEMGHSFGLGHDSQMEGCHAPQGFMGPGYNYLYKLCYTDALMRVIGKLDCLFKDNFVDKKPVSEIPFWLKFF